MKKFTLAVATLATAPLGALAQDSGGLEEIVVTAQRREQNLQEVPISVSAFSAQALEKSNVRAATDYLVQTPNVSFTEDAQSGARGISVSIRGVNNLVSGENAFVNSVGNYLDGFSIASVPSGVANPQLIDMERVEVLRGPQGTYFGRNSLGGALNLTTHAPTDKYEGEIRVGGEAYQHHGDMYNVTGIFNAPLTDTFKLRGVAYYEDSSGMVKNIGPGNDTGHEYTDLRLRATWDLTDATTLGATIIYSDENQGADETVPSGYLDLDSVDTFGLNPGTAFDPGTGFWPHNQDKLSHDLNEQNKLETTVGILNLTHQFSEGLALKAIAGLIDATQDRLFDNDLVGNTDVLKRTNKYDGNSWSFETRLEATGGAVDWVVGAMYAEDEQKQHNDVAVSSDPTATLVKDGVEYGFLPPFPEGLGLALNHKDFKVESVAAFLDLTWHLSDQLELIAGARYTNDSVKKEYAAYGIAPSCGCGPPDPNFFPSFINFPRPVARSDDSFDDVSPRVGVRFAWSDNASVYATISKGYKAGGSSLGNDTNNDSAPLVIPFDEETLWNYEVGIKTETADHRVRVNASVFYMDWSNLQVEAFRFLTPGDLSSNFEQTVNVDAKAKGVELELQTAPTDNFTLGASAGYLDTEITDEPTCDPFYNMPTCIQITGGYAVTAKGLDMPKAPKLTANAFAQYDFDSGLWVRGEYQHRDSQYSDIEALTNKQTRGPSPNQGLTRVVGPDEFPYKVPSFDVFNLRGGYDWDRLGITVYVQNVFGEEYYTGTQENFGLSGIRLRPHPTTYGAQLSFKF
jgi:iron complex outermembrane receptor protein